MEDNSALQNKVKSGLNSFLTMIVLTYLNIFLFLINSSVSFPFSAFIPSVLAAIANSLRQTGASPALILILVSFAVIFTSIFLLLFFLSGKYLAPVWIALILFILDTAAMLYCAENIKSVALDVLFHIWVIWSLASLIKAKLGLNKAEQTPGKSKKTAPKKSNSKK